MSGLRPGPGAAPPPSIGDEVAAAAGLDGLALGEVLHQGVLAEVRAAEHRGEPLVLKVYRRDLAAVVRADPDGRFAAAARHLALPPFFARSAERVAALDPGGGVRVPEVRAEGRTASGLLFTLMTRLAGAPCRPLPRGRRARRRLARELGAVLARMHARAVVPAAWREVGWADEYEAVLHAVADHLPAPVAGDERARWRLRLAVQRAVDHFRGLDPGPTVLAHGDLGADNVLLDADGRVAAVVDFQLSCLAPAAMDLRWVEETDAAAFLAAYGGTWRPREARWLGRFFQLVWEGLILVFADRYSGARFPDDEWARAGRRFHALVRRLARRP